MGSEETIRRWRPVPFENHTGTVGAERLQAQLLLPPPPSHSSENRWLLLQLKLHLLRRQRDKPGGKCLKFVCRLGASTSLQ